MTQIIQRNSNYRDVCKNVLKICSQNISLREQKNRISAIGNKRMNRMMELVGHNSIAVAVDTAYQIARLETSCSSQQIRHPKLPSKAKHKQPQKSKEFNKGSSCEQNKKKLATTVNDINSNCQSIFVTIGDNVRVNLKKVPVAEIQPNSLFNNFFLYKDMQRLERKRGGTKYEYAQRMKEIKSPKTYVDYAICFLKQNYPKVVLEHVAASSTREILWDKALKIVAVLKSKKWRFYDLQTTCTISEESTDSANMHPLLSLSGLMRNQII